MTAANSNPPIGFGPGGIDCEDVLNDVYLYLDDESNPALVSRIREHLDGCGPCLRQYGLEQDVKALIARCCGGDVAPDHVRAHIRIDKMPKNHQKQKPYHIYITL